MNSAEESPSRCLLCRQSPEPVLSGLFDDRFGAPGVYEIRRCPGCGLEQTWPQPTAEELKGLYEGFYNAGIEPDSAYRRLRERFLTSGLYRLWLRWDGDISFHRRRGAGRLLDLGCNEGRSLSLYARNGFQAEGLEINEAAARMARARGFKVYTVPLDRFVPDEGYDVVVLANVLEHALNPLDMLSRVRRWLQPQGEVWISCPNAAGLWRRVFGGSWINWHVPYHLWHFSPRTLKETLKQTGFDVVEMQTFTPALWTAQSLCVSLRTRAGQVNRIMRSTPVVAGLMLAARGMVLPFFGRADRRLLGDCLIVRAQRQAETSCPCGS